MAWEIVSADYVADMCGLTVQELDDRWYDFAVDLIRRRVGESAVQPVQVTEKLNGNGTRYIRVSRPPIDFVSQLKVEDAVIPSNLYTNTELYVVLVDKIAVNPHVEMDVFPVGIANVEVTYTTKDPDNVVANAIALVIRELATIKKTQGGLVRFQTFVSGERNENDLRALSPAAHKRVIQIVESLLPRGKFNAR